MSAQSARPFWHGNGPNALVKARRRAGLLGLSVIWSAPPKASLAAPAASWGYWTEPKGAMLRTMQGEREVTAADSA